MATASLQVRLPKELLAEADHLRQQQVFDLSRAAWFRFCIKQQHAREKARLAQEDPPHEMGSPA